MNQDDGPNRNRKDDGPNRYEAIFFMEGRSRAKRESDSLSGDASTDDIAAKRRKIDAEVRLALMRHHEDTKEYREAIFNYALKKQKQEQGLSASIADDAFPMLPFNPRPNAQNSQPSSLNAEASPVNNEITKAEGTEAAEPSLSRHVTPSLTRPALQVSKVRFPSRSSDISSAGGIKIPYMPIAETSASAKEGSQSNPPAAHNATNTLETHKSKDTSNDDEEEKEKVERANVGMRSMSLNDV